MRPAPGPAFEECRRLRLETVGASFESDAVASRGFVYVVKPIGTPAKNRCFTGAATFRALSLFFQRNICDKLLYLQLESNVCSNIKLYNGIIRSSVCKP